MEVLLYNFIKHINNNVIILNVLKFHAERITG